MSQLRSPPALTKTSSTLEELFGLERRPMGEITMSAILPLHVDLTRELLPDTVWDFQV